MDSSSNLSREQAAALFAEAARGIEPANPSVKSVAERLAPFSQTLLKYRDDGYSHEQLANILRSPKIGIEVTIPSLKKHLTTLRTAKKRRKVGAAGKSANSAGSAISKGSNGSNAGDGPENTKR